MAYISFEVPHAISPELWYECLSVPISPVGRSRAANVFRIQVICKYTAHLPCLCVACLFFLITLRALALAAASLAQRMCEDKTL